MTTEFDDSEHFALFKGPGALRSGNSFEVRWSEITLAALRAAGFLDNMVDGLTPPSINQLWLDKNTDPATLKEWDPIGANWQQVSNQTFFGRVPWRGSWASSPVYRRADIVSYQGNIWIAVQPSQNKIPMEGAYWNLFIPALADNSVTTAKLVDKSVTPSKLDAGIMAFATRSAAAAASINASIHSITITGNLSEGDGNGGLYLDTNTGSLDSFTSADDRTWYRSADVSKDRVRDGELPLTKLTNSPPMRLVGRDWSDVNGPFKSLTPETVRALLNVPDNEALAALARAALDFRYGGSNVYDYLRLPPIPGFNEGFLIQWGVDAGAKTITFPTPFPKAVCFVGGTMRASLANYVFSFGYTNVTQTGFDASPRFINTSSASGVPSENYNWIALGY